MNDLDIYIYAIVALLPLTACMVVLQVNPYYALITRGILGAMAALIYTILGAADVALTEALVGTMLAVTLYAVAVRSSLVMRIGVLEDEPLKTETQAADHADSMQENQPGWGQLMDDLRTLFNKHYMRLELVPYTNPQALERALMQEEIHATCTRSDQLKMLQHEDQHLVPDLVTSGAKPYNTTTRIQRIYDMMQSELSSPATSLTYINPSNSGETH